MSRITQQGRAPRLLLVDDNAGDILLLRKTFSRLNIAVDLIVALSAEAALVELTSCSDLRVCPDLILLDLNLPRMGGLEFLEILKAKPEWRHIPVIILSSSSSDQDVTASYDRYASGFVTKPYSLEDYEHAAMTIVGYWFRLVQTPSASGKPSEPT